MQTIRADRALTTEGWRGDVVGKSFRDVLDGKLAIRVANRKAEQPLEFIEVDD